MTPNETADVEPLNALTASWETGLYDAVSSEGESGRPARVEYCLSVSRASISHRRIHRPTCCALSARMPAKNQRAGERIAHSGRSELLCQDV